MIAFVVNQGILNMMNDYASPHPQRLAAFHGVREIAYRAMGVEVFDYVAAFTPDRMVEMGTYLARLRNGLSAPHFTQGLTTSEVRSRSTPHSARRANRVPDGWDPVVVD